MSKQATVDKGGIAVGKEVSFGGNRVTIIRFSLPKGSVERGTYDPGRVWYAVKDERTRELGPMKSETYGTFALIVGGGML